MTAALAVAGALGVAGCAPATLSSTAVASPRASASPPEHPGVPAASDPSELRARMDVRHLDPDITGTILEFASDGRSVIFSSGFADDAAPGAAPDLWQIRADREQPPEMLWRNPDRDHSIVKLAGDLGTIAFADIPLDGSRAWDLWLIPEEGHDPIRLDSHPGDRDVPGFVPSFSVSESAIAWTAFDRGPRGPVSQLLYAAAPEWQPTLLLETLAADAELWLPSLYANRLAYTEVRYSPDRSRDTRSVKLLDLADPAAESVRVGGSDRAVMPLVLGETVIWKEADPGFHMLNWGHLWRLELGGPGPARLDTGPADYVNYPSLGSRFVAWWSADAFTFVVYDLVEDRPRVVERYPLGSRANVLRPHIAYDLLAWLYVVGEGRDSTAELRYAFMPPARDP